MTTATRACFHMAQGLAPERHPSNPPVSGPLAGSFVRERRIDQVVQADGQVLDMTYNQATGQLTSVDVLDDGTYSFT